MSNLYITVIIILFVVMFLVIIKFFYLENSTDDDFDQEVEDIKDFVHEKAFFFSPNELNFYKQIKEYLKEKDIFIFANVKLADLFWVRDKKNDKYAYWMFWKINQKHIDFVLTNVKGEILLCIELDDCTHDKENKSHLFKNKLFNTLEVPFKRFKTSHTYDFSDLEI